MNECWKCHAEIRRFEAINAALQARIEELQQERLQAIRRADGEGVNKSGDGVRITVLCGWCRVEMPLRVGMLRSRLKNSSMPLFCSPRCSGKYQAYSRDQKQYGVRPMLAKKEAKA